MEARGSMYFLSIVQTLATQGRKRGTFRPACTLGNISRVLLFTFPKETSSAKIGARTKRCWRRSAQVFKHEDLKGLDTVGGCPGVL